MLAILVVLVVLVLLVVALVVLELVVLVVLAVLVLLILLVVHVLLVLLVLFVFWIVAFPRALGLMQIPASSQLKRVWLLKHRDPELQEFQEGLARLSKSGAGLNADSCEQPIEKGSVGL